MNCPVVFRVSEPIDRTRFTHVLGTVSARHPALHSSLERRKRVLVQIAHRGFVPPVQFVTTSEAADDDVDTHLKREIQRDISSSEPSFRAVVFGDGTGADTVCLSLHHAFSDGWSGTRIFDDLAAAYSTDKPLVDLGASSFADFAKEEAGYRASQQGHRDRSFWETVLSEADFCSMPLDASKPAKIGPTERALHALEPRASAQLVALAAVLGCDLFSMMLALYFASLHRLTGSMRPGAASLFSGRVNDRYIDCIGFFISTLYLDAPVEADMTLRALIARVAAVSRTASGHQRYPLHLHPPSLVQRDGRRADDCVFQILPYALEPKPFGSAVATPLLLPIQPRRFDFELTIAPTAEGISILSTWNGDRLERSWVERLLKYYRKMANALLANLDRKLSEVLLS